MLQTTARTSFTLVFPITGEQILLGLKRRGFGQDLMNGFGGKVEDGESIEDAAIRELEEECGIRTTVSELEPRGRLTIVRPIHAGPTVFAKIFLFTCRTWSGHPVESDEMQPVWFDTHCLPFKQMWPDAPLYLPHLLKDTQDTCITGKFQYVESSTTTLDGWWLKELSQEQNRKAHVD
ncbi:hypothetical protein CcaverHIS002_0209610 [Cutaneotrichosporon cavernicola]|nr:hypothetical protein CcaverHIS002_0209610 [Cutaneotrichosporon cavernicola]BEI97373.1 hypothetical protein CcaverHIS631_0209620 [Cutaneotrichosporon cavernicola]